MLTVIFSSSAIAKVYKWKDANGKTHYSATPPPVKSKVKSEEIKIHKTPASSLRDIPASESTVVYPKTKKASKKRKTTRKQKKRNNPVVNLSGAAAEKCKSALNKLGITNEPGELSSCIKDYNSGSKGRSEINDINAPSFDTAKAKAELEEVKKFKKALNTLGND